MSIKVTIFTATYNRASLLEKLYFSLKCQGNQNFEWVIVDDASTDDTEEKVKGWIEETKQFSIIYQKQVRGGKHRAINKGLDIACGEYFFIVDSDDILPPKAVDLVIQWIGLINEPDVVGVAGLKVLKDGKICGGNPKIAKSGYIKASNLERRKYGLVGDKAEVYNTNILRKHKFPEFKGENFVTEGVCWNAIAAEGGKLYWFNEPIYICQYLQDGLTKTGANEIKGRLKNFQGYCYYVRQSLKIKECTEAVTDFRAFNKTCKARREKLLSRAKYLEMNKFEFICWYFIKQPWYYMLRILEK